MVAITAHAQRFPFYNLNVEDGLIQSQVRSMVQDKYGHLWIGTVGGLSMYDGNNFTNYTVRNGLLNNTINALVLDKKDNLWIGGPDGVSKFDGRSFKHYIFQAPENANANTVLELKSAQGDTIWARTSKQIFLITKDKNSELKLPNESAEPTALLATSGGLYIAAVGGRLYRYQNKHWDSIYYNQKGIPNEAIYTTELYTDHKNKLWLTTNLGLFRLDDSVVKRAYVKSANINNWPIMYSIAESQKNTYWLGYTGAIQYKDSILTAYSKENGFTDNQVRDILCDKEGNIWFGTDGQGIYRFSGGDFSILDESSGLEHEEVTSIAATAKGRVYLGTYHGGLYYYENGQVAKFPMPINSSISISSINIKSEYDFWLGTTGLGLWHYYGGKFIQHTTPEIASNAITSLYRDTAGKLWIGTGNGFSILVKDSFSNISMKNEPVYAFQNIGKDSMLMATYDGLKLYHHNNIYPYITNTAVDSANAQCLVLHNNKLWVGTSDNGVIRYDLYTHKAIVINKQNGLKSDFVYNITVDRKGDVWAGTGFGIHRITFHGNTPSIQFYGSGQGIEGVESNQNAVYNMPDGSIWFGTTKGALHFFPEKETANQEPISIVLKSVKLFGDNIYDTTYYDSTAAWYNVPYGLKLPYQKNNITFTFQAITLSGIEQVRYRYRIEGLDAPWSDWDIQNTVTYSALPPGDYTLHVAAMTGDSSNIKELSYPFTIITPIHKTAWFRLVVLATCILIGIGLQYMANRRKQKRQTLLENLRKEEQRKIRERTAEDFHDEIGNKLTRINVLTNVLTSKIGKTTPDTERILKQIQDNTGELYSGTQDILWSLKPSNDNLYEILYRIRDFANDLFEDTDVTFTFVGDDERWKQYKLPLDMSRNLIMIFKEALNNALKYSGADHIKMTTTLKQNHILQIILTDNGKGFDIETVKRGNGLHNMNTRAKRLGGNIYIDSTEGRGTSISLNFKLQKPKSN